jgi:hypothetical protein
MLFECGLRSLESLLSGQQCLYIIQVRTLVPRIASSGPAVPLCYSSAGSDTSNRFFRASSASKLFKCGLRSLESLLSGQQFLHFIRVWAPVPRIALFGSSTPPCYSSMDPGLSTFFIWATAPLHIIRVQASVLLIASFGPSTPLHYSSAGSVPRIMSFGPSVPLYQSNTGFSPRITISLSALSLLPETWWQ